MGEKDESLKRCYKKKKVFHSNRYTKITTISTPSTPVWARTASKVSTSQSSLDGSTSLSAKKMKLNISNKDASDNLSHFDSNEANICKNIQQNSNRRG